MGNGCWNVKCCGMFLLVCTTILSYPPLSITPGGNTEDRRRLTFQATIFVEGLQQKIQRGIIFLSTFRWWNRLCMDNSHKKHVTSWTCQMAQKTVLHLRWTFTSWYYQGKRVFLFNIRYTLWSVIDTFHKWLPILSSLVCI